MEDLDDRNASYFGAVNQALHVREEWRNAFFVP
jgi:hypothetical protein